MNKKGNKTIKYNTYEIIGILLFAAFLLSFEIFGSSTETDIIYRILGILFCAFEFLYILKRKTIKIPLFIKYLVIFLIFVFSTSLLFNSHSGFTLAIYISLYIGVSFMAYNFFDSIDFGREKLLSILLLNGIILSIYIFMFYGIGNYFQLLSYGKRVGSEIANVNMIGINTIMSCLIIYYYYIFKRKKAPLIFLIPLLIISFGTGSKKVIIAMIIGVILITYSKFKSKITMNSIIKLIMSIIVLVISYKLISNLPIFSTIFTRFENLFTSILQNGEFDIENLERENFIKYGFQVFLNNPLLGVGFGNSSNVLFQKFNHATYFHNNYIELLATTGIVGTFLFYISYFKSFLYNYKTVNNKNDDLSKFCIFLIIIQLIIEYGMVSNELPFIYVYFVLWNLKTNNKGDEVFNENKKN